MLKPLQDCRGFGKTKRNTNPFANQNVQLSWPTDKWLSFSLVFYFPAVSSGCGWCNHQRTSLKQWKDIEQNCAPVLSLLHSFQVLKWVKSFLCRSICYFKFLISYICCRIDFYLSVSIAYLLSKNHLTNNFIFICRSSHFENSWSYNCYEIRIFTNN